MLNPTQVQSLSIGDTVFIKYSHHNSGNTYTVSKIGRKWIHVESKFQRFKIDISTGRVDTEDGYSKSVYRTEEDWKQESINYKLTIKLREDIIQKTRNCSDLEKLTQINNLLTKPC